MNFGDINTLLEVIERASKHGTRYAVIVNEAHRQLDKIVAPSKPVGAPKAIPNTSADTDSADNMERRI